MGRVYTVYGDYGYANEAVLYTSTSEKDAIEWTKTFVCEGYTDGHDVIEVAYHTEDGEYHTVYTFKRPDFGEDDEGILKDEW